MTMTTPSMAAPMASKQIYATGSGGKKYKPFDIAGDAPVYNYTVPGHGLQTHALKDQGGQEWYLTDGGQWRNSATKALSKTAPTWGAATPAAAAPAAPAAPAGPPAPKLTLNADQTAYYDNAATNLGNQVQLGDINDAQMLGELSRIEAELARGGIQAPAANPPATYKSVWDFVNEKYQDLLTPDSTSVAAPTWQPLKSFQEFMPKDWTASPAYEFNLKRGTEDLNKQLSALGLLGSRAQLERQDNLQQRVAADETQRVFDAAKTEYDKSSDNQLQKFISENQQYITGLQTKSNEKQSLQKLISDLQAIDYQGYNQKVESDKDYALADKQQKISVADMILGLMAELNPAKYGLPAAQASGNLGIDLGKALNELSIQAGSLSGGGGGGGSGGGSPAVQAPNGAQQVDDKNLGIANILTTLANVATKLF